MPVLEAVRILGGGRVRAKSTFSFVMQLNTTAAYNWGQCSLISSFFHMTILPYWRTNNNNEHSIDMNQVQQCLSHFGQIEFIVDIFV